MSVNQWQLLNKQKHRIMIQKYAFKEKMIITALIVKMRNLNVVKEARIKTTCYIVRHRQLALLSALWEGKIWGVWQQGRGTGRQGNKTFAGLLLWHRKAWAHELLHGVGDWMLQNHDRPRQSTKRLMMTSQKCKQTRSNNKQQTHLDRYAGSSVQRYFRVDIW